MKRTQASEESGNGIGAKTISHREDDWMLQNNSDAYTPEFETVEIGPFATAGRLLDRATGAVIAAAMSEAFARIPPYGLVIVDLLDIESATFSGMGALLAPFQTPGVHGLPERYLLLRVHDRRDEFVDALERAAREQGLVVPAMDEGGRRRVFGRLTLVEAQTLAAVWANTEAGGLTAAALAERMGLMTTAASNRLKHLFDRRLIRREEHLRSVGGREFIYRPLVSP
jgi:hypothetical protein